MLLLGFLVGCDTFNLNDGGPTRSEPYPLQRADSTTVKPGLTAMLQTPDTVALGDAFDLRTRVGNQTGKPITVTTGNAAFWTIGIYDGDEVVPVEGTMLAYATVLTGHTIDPGATLITIDLQAVRSSEKEPLIDPGTYTARLTLDWKINGTTVEDTLETTIFFTER